MNTSEITSFTVIENDTNYSEIPTGIITPDQYTWEQFITQHALEIVDETTIRAEWGNGEGYDSFTVQFNNF